MRPHKRQPTRLPRPWHSPGKNTGAGCHFLLQCMKVKSESEAAQSCPTFSDPMDCSPPGSSAHEIFQARVLEWDAIAFSVSHNSRIQILFKFPPCSFPDGIYPCLKSSDMRVYVPSAASPLDSCFQSEVHSALLTAVSLWSSTRSGGKQWMNETLLWMNPSEKPNSSPCTLHQH